MKDYDNLGLNIPDDYPLDIHWLYFFLFGLLLFLIWVALVSVPLTVVHSSNTSISKNNYIQCRKQQIMFAVKFLWLKQKK
jgi:hypothetical protein